MLVTDLSHVLTNGMPVFPGTDPLQLKPASTLDHGGFNELLVSMTTHTGTHIDCGFHLIRDGFDTSTVQPGQFYGTGCVIDCRQSVQNGIISRSLLEPEQPLIEKAGFVLLHTGWSKYWGTDRYFSGFPVPDVEAASFLAQFSLKGVGMDAPSFDPVDSTAFAVHRILLSRGIVLIENLTHLETLPPEDFTFCCFPLKFEKGDGSPVRAVAIVASDPLSMTIS